MYAAAKSGKWMNLKDLKNQVMDGSVTEDEFNAAIVELHKGGRLILPGHHQGMLLYGGLPPTAVVSCYRSGCSALWTHLRRVANAQLPRHAPPLHLHPTRNLNPNSNLQPNPIAH